MGDQGGDPFEVACSLMEQIRDTYAKTMHLKDDLREHLDVQGISRSSVCKEVNKREIRNKKLQHNKNITRG